MQNFIGERTVEREIPVVGFVISNFPTAGRINKGKLRRAFKFLTKSSIKQLSSSFIYNLTKPLSFSISITYVLTLEH